MKIDESWFVKPKDKNFPSKVSCGGVVIRKSESVLYVALLGDKKFEDYLLPKGRQEKGEPLVETAKREIAEESGLTDLEYICPLGSKERLTFKKDEWRKTYYYLFRTVQKSGKQKLEEGEKDYFLAWFDIDKLPTLFWPEQKELIEENKDKIIKMFGRG